MAVTVAIPSRLTSDAAIPFPDDPFEEYVVDATGLQFVEPLGLVQLVLLMHHLSEIGWVTFRAPMDADVGNYLARMDFYKHIPSKDATVDGDVDPHGMHRTDCSDVLIPVRAFSTDDDVEYLVEDVVKFLQGMVAGKKLPMEVYSTLSVAIPELAGNAASHSQSRCGGFLVAQRYRPGSSYLAVGDIGMGIRKHLARNAKYTGIETDTEAIKLAMKPGVTGTKDRRGWGYDVVIDELAKCRGAVLYIRSGSGWVRTLVNGERRNVHSGSLATTSPGTLVQVVING